MQLGLPERAGKRLVGVHPGASDHAGRCSAGGGRGDGRRAAGGRSGFSGLGWRGRVEVDEGQRKAQLGQHGGAQFHIGQVGQQARRRQVAKDELGDMQLQRRSARGVYAFVDEIAQDVLHRLGQLVDHVEQAELKVALAGVCSVGMEGEDLQTQLAGHGLNGIAEGQPLVDVQTQQAGRDRRVEQAHLGGHDLEQVQELIDKGHAGANGGERHLGQRDGHHIRRAGGLLDEGLHQLVDAGGQDLRQAELHQMGCQLGQRYGRIELHAKHLTA